MDNAKLLSKTQILVDSDLTRVPMHTLKLVQQDEADIQIPVVAVAPSADAEGATVITVADKLDAEAHYLLSARELGKTWAIGPSITTLMISTILSAALINNFVFTRYLGLCVFFGVTRKKDTAIGMGVTFTVVAFLSGLISWLFHHFALAPLKLEFLQIIAFIGVVACLVQASDSILRKIRPTLHRKFGIYLVLITTNCIILAVPLLNASKHAGFVESISLSMGAGLGFALALFLMSCAREKVELAPVPPVFRGLPVAFIIAGLFALSFLGFSGLKLFF
ncbi:MAG: NADH-quinone reductase [Oligoflexia bacterium]|nr:NADH-quinone reductase [Oligoflexia bacterium]